MWRTIINGYPYKSLEELGVANIDEAFTATKQAVYCYLYENTPDDYEGIGEAGERTLNALKKIVSDAQNSTETIQDNTILVVEESKEWEEDDLDENYISKVYSVKTKVNHTNYELIIEENLPKNSKIVKLDGTESTKFGGEEKFKIMLPKEELKESGNFNFTIKTEAKTKPILYGASQNPSLQNYAVTIYSFEDASTRFNDTYPKIEKPQESELPEETKKVIKTEKKETIKPLKVLPETGM